jgi:hypothetical protein
MLGCRASNEKRFWMSRVSAGMTNASKPPFAQVIMLIEQVVELICWQPQINTPNDGGDLRLTLV